MRLFRSCLVAETGMENWESGTFSLVRDTQVSYIDLIQGSYLLSFEEKTA